MKKLILFLLLTVTFFACKNEEKKEAAPTGDLITSELKPDPLADSSTFTTLEWVGPTTKELGKIKKGQTVEIPYTVKNTGNKPLVIAAVEPGCGCTVAEKPEQPIMPGKEEKIVAKFNSENQTAGIHSKVITVRANTKPQTAHILNFNVEVVE